MNKMVPGLAGGKMSSSDPNSKIDFLDAPEVVKKKIKAAFCEEGNVTDNGLLAFIRAVAIPIAVMHAERGDSVRPFVSADAPSGSVFTVSRNEKYGGPLHFSDYAALEKAFADREIHPGDLKTAVTTALMTLLDPIRKAFEENEEWKAVEQLAYPPPEKPAKKQASVRLWLQRTRLTRASRKRSEPVIRPRARLQQDRQPERWKGLRMLWTRRISRLRSSNYRLSVIYIVICRRRRPRVACLSRSCRRSYWKAGGLCRIYSCNARSVRPRSKWNGRRVRHRPRRRCGAATAGPCRPRQPPRRAGSSKPASRAGDGRLGRRKSRWTR